MGSEYVSRSFRRTQALTSCRERAQAVATVTAAPTVATTTLSRSFAAVMPSTTAPLSSDARTLLRPSLPPRREQPSRPHFCCFCSQEMGTDYRWYCRRRVCSCHHRIPTPPLYTPQDDRDRKSYPGAEGYVNTSPSEWLIISVGPLKIHDDIVVTARGHNMVKRAKSKTRSIIVLLPSTISQID